MKTQGFLGSGLAFPLRLNGRGGLQTAEGEQKVQESIRMILGTQHGERMMRPTFGANLRSLVFAPNNRATASLAQHYVTEALATWEPRIILDEVTVDNDHRNQCLLIQIRYRLKATYEPQSLVYPFYLERP
jgi:phage baseplate assembly protein W